MNDKKFCFYFDESFHDRAIKLSYDGSINLFSDGLSDTFVGGFIGVEFSKIKGFENKFLEFESKYKKIYGLSDRKELKGSIVKQKNFKYGIASLNYNSTKLYLDFFDILIDYNCIIQLNLFSKIEKLLSEVFKGSIEKLNIIVKPKAFIYSITKFIFRYRDLEIAEKLLLNSNTMSSRQIIDEIRFGLNFILKKISHIERKVQEEKTLNELLYVLDLLNNNIHLSENIKWNYDSIFEGLDILLEELKISPLEIELKLDEEKNILDSANRYSRNMKVDSYDSQNVVGIRSADILANFFGRLIYLMQKELEETDQLNVKGDLHYISKGWFRINEDKFKLSKKIGYLLGYQSLCHINTSVFMDHSFVIFSYFNYINNYKDINEYRKYTDEYHYINGNRYIIKQLQEKLSNLY